MMVSRGIGGAVPQFGVNYLMRNHVNYVNSDDGSNELLP